MRWQDLKENQKLKQNLQKRADILRLLRKFFDEKGFIEIDSPLMVKAGNLEPNLDLFKTKIIDSKWLEMEASLITSPEYSLKKLLAAGLTKIYQLGKCFRNREPWGGGHNPEFTMLEWYEAGKNYQDLMGQMEELFLFLVKECGMDAENFSYLGKKINLEHPWDRLSMREAWQKYAGVDLNENLSYDTMRSLAIYKNYTVNEGETFDDIFFKIFLTEVEPKITALKHPVFLYDYPASMAAFSRLKKNDSRYAERFEVYIGGWELANAYTELVDAEKQEKRFLADQERCRIGGKVAPEIDQDFLEAMKAGIPDCAGIALGVDRLIMLLIDSKDISEVVPFTAGEMFRK